MINYIKGIYIHIPFCHSICHYCDFPRVYYNEEQADKYLDSLEYEINSTIIDKSEIETIYIGGGTPSALNYNQLERLLKFIESLNLDKIVEYSIELNPESCDENKIKLLAKYVNRVSLGVQSFDEGIIYEIGRKHNKEEVVNCVQNLRKYGINNISIDLMYGFNIQSLDILKNDLKIIKELSIKHVSVYSLIIEKGSVFYNNKYEISNIEYEQNLLINDYLINELGFIHYEVSNYAVDGYQSMHNMMYWHNDRYYGFGLGAGGFIKDYRYYNTKSITNYINNQFNQVKEYYQCKEDYLIDQIFTSFRIFSGIDLNVFNKNYNINFIEYFNEAIVNNYDKICIEDNKLFFTKKGEDYLNEVIIDFIDIVERMKEK
ncbi:MAG: radical SAM family heme chaperone HemW [Erysipelotrichales bacterium]